MQTNAAVYAKLAGRHADIPTAIAKAATPRQMRIYLPLLGNQYVDDPGMPMVALFNQRFRIRVYLKRLEDVIEASDGRIRPMPWQQQFRAQTQTGVYEFQTLSRANIGGPTIALETTQIYISHDARDYLRKVTLPIPFIQNQLCRFTVEDNKWFPVINTGAAVSLSLPLDFIGAVSRLTIGVQSDADILSGRLYKTEPPEGGALAYLWQLRLNLGLRDRMNAFPVNIWQNVTNYYKNYREPHSPNGGVLNVYTMTFGSADNSIPTGTFNMSRTMEAVIYADLAAISVDPRTNSRKVYISVYAEAWNIFNIQDGKGIVLFAD